MPPKILEASPATIAEAVALLKAGGSVALPTETVYGLGADAQNEEALEAIYRRKGRPLDNPMIAHVSSVDQARLLTASWDARCDLAAERWWPGPLTLVVPKATSVSSRLTAGLATVALRAPDHEVARDLIDALGGAIAAPSANRSGHVSPTTAQHVADDFADDDSLLILDGGPCQVGIESTVLALGKPDEAPCVLRPGTVTLEELQGVFGMVEAPTFVRQDAAPGTSLRHYAPQAPCQLVASGDMAGQVAREQGPVALLCFDPAVAGPPHRIIQMPRDAASYAALLYDALRRADTVCPVRILIETPPESTGLWRSVHDRLKRATTG
jgi:L-threonylcarbamoyladenylate synthase